ncbi:hypothetical protein [Bremerella sp.]|uniref:hypothetical protein n=1 Tax=Bremerella sp. TaxID=2795602 RepID=UPI00391B34EB
MFNRSNRSDAGQDRGPSSTPDRSNSVQPSRDIRDMFNRSNRPDADRDRGPSSTPGTSGPGSDRPDTAQPSRDIRDMFNRTNRPNLDSESRRPRQPITSPDSTPGSNIRERFRPGDASDIRSRLEALNRGNSTARPSLPDRVNQDRPSSADRDGRPTIDRDSLPMNRPDRDRPEADRPGPRPGNRDQSDRDGRPAIDRDSLPINRPDRERPGAELPGPRPGNRDQVDQDRPGRGPNADDPGRNRPGQDVANPDSNRDQVRPDFDWKDRANRDPQFRQQLDEVRRRGTLDDDAIRDRLANVEDRFRNGNRDDRGGDRDGNRGDRDDRRGDWDRDRDWDGRWDDRHRRHVPDNWYRHAFNVRHHHHHDRFGYGWNNRWYPNNRYLSSWYFHTYRPRPGYWWTWCSPYRLSNWSFWGSYPSYPVYYDYGSTIVYDTQYIYVEEEPIATREQYALEAIALANEGRKILQSRPPTQGNGNPDDWLPLGVFVLTDTQSGEGDIYLQLAVDKEGLLAGTYFNATTDTSLPVWGKVDPQSQRAAWLIGESSSTVMETGIYNLSQEAASVLVHYGTQRDETWMLVRLPEDEVTNPGG